MAQQPAAPTHLPPIALALSAAGRQGRGWIALLLGLATFGFYLFNAAHLVLMDPDEGRYALVAQQMLHSGDYLAPILFDQPYFDKPIGFFWLLAGSFHLFGVNETAARLVPALGAALMVAGVYQLGRLLTNPRAALIAAVLLATSTFMVIAGRFIRMDGWLGACVTWAVYFWARVYFERRTRWTLVAGYACLAVACLLKGLVGILLPLGAIGLFLAWRRDWRACWRGGILPGLLLVVALAAPWFLCMEQRFPGYLMKYFWEQHFVRAAADKFGRSQPPYYLPGVVLGGFLPWTALLVMALWRTIPLRFNRDRLASPGLTLCLCWAGLGTIPFLFSRSLLAIYALPALPPLALITGAYVDRMLSHAAGKEARIVFGITIGLLAASLAVMIGADVQVMDHFPIWTTVRRLVVAIPVLAITWLAVQRGRGLLAAGLAVALALAGGLEAASLEGPAIFRMRSSQSFAADVVAANDAKLLLIGPSPTYALPFYVHDVLPVRFLDHGPDFLEYADDQRVLLGLLTGKRMYAAVRERIGDRLEVLEQRGGMYLARVRPTDTTTAPMTTSSATPRPQGLGTGPHISPQMCP